MPRRQPDDIDRRIGRTIRTYRRLRNLGQDELGHVLGISSQQVQKFESGRNCLAVSQLFRISAALRVPIDVFLMAARNEPLMEACHGDLLRC